MSRGWHGPHSHLRGPRPETVERIERIRAMRAQGQKLAAIAEELGVSKQRVHQIISRMPDGRAYKFGRGYNPARKHHANPDPENAA